VAGLSWGGTVAQELYLLEQRDVLRRRIAGVGILY